MFNCFKCAVLELLEKPWIIFAIIALFFGSLFLFITPAFEVPDEIAHLYRACEVADGIFYNKYPAHETHYDKLFKFLPLRDNTEFHFMSGYSPVMYLTSALAIKIGSIITDNGVFIFYFARLANLLAYILLCAFAIKITPVFKYQFMFIALLPMALYEGMSLSADSFNNGFSFLFFAFVLKLIFEKKETTKKDFTILSVLAFVGALCKGLVYPVLLFPFINNFSSEFKYKNKYIYLWPIIIITLFICWFWHHINNVILNPTLSEYNTSDIIFSQPQKVINMIINTIKAYNFEFIRQCIGLFGLYLAKFDYTISIFIFLSSLIMLGKKIPLKLRLTSFLSFIIFYVSLLYMFLINWTGVNDNLIQGIQGRYFISALPFLFLAFSFPVVSLSDKYKQIFKIIMVLYSLYLLTTMCIILYEYYFILGIGVHYYTNIIMLLK